MIAAMIKSAIVLAAAAFIASLMKRQSAAFRHAVWTAGLIGAMAIPLFTVTLPSWQTDFATSVLSFLQKALGSLGIFRQGAIALWIAGATAGILLLLYSAGRLAWVAIGAEPVEDARWAALAEEVRRRLGIRRPVRLLQNRSVPFLGTWGIMAPRVLLPRDAESWPDDRIRMVLAHELAHIQRHDWVVQVLADAARAIYWFNPIFWLASSRLRRESEHACDDAVVRLGAAGTRYAEELLAMTRALRSEERLQSPILSMAQPSHLEQRLVALLNPSLNRLAATPWAVIVVAAVAIALTLPLAAVRSEREALQLADTPAASAASLPSQTEPRSSTVESIHPAIKSQPPVVPAPTASRKPDGSIAIPTAPVTSVDAPETAPAAVPHATSQAELPPAATAVPANNDSPAEKTQPAIPEPPVSAAAIAAVSAPVSNLNVPVTAPPPPFDCKVTSSRVQMKTSTIEKTALGSGPWLINEDRTIWAADQPYIANRSVNTVWMRPANTELIITARRLDGDAPQLTVGPAAPYTTGYIAIGVVFPAAGCWEVTGTAGKSKLTFITKVRE